MKTRAPALLVPLLVLALVASSAAAIEDWSAADPFTEILPSPSVAYNDGELGITATLGFYLDWRVWSIGGEPALEATLGWSVNKATVTAAPFLKAHKLAPIALPPEVAAKLRIARVLVVGSLAPDPALSMRIDPGVLPAPFMGDYGSPSSIGEASSKFNALGREDKLKLMSFNKPRLLAWSEIFQQPPQPFATWMVTKGRAPAKPVAAELAKAAATKGLRFSKLAIESCELDLAPVREWLLGLEREAIDKLIAAVDKKDKAKAAKQTAAIAEAEAAYKLAAEKVPRARLDFDAKSELQLAEVKARAGLPETLGSTVNSIGVEMISIRDGTFTMGSPAAEADRLEDEGPQRLVSLSGFALSDTEITQLQWAAVMGSNPAAFIDPARPVEQVSWYGALAFCNLLSIREKLDPCYRIKGSTNPADWGPVPRGRDEDWSAVACDWAANGYRLPTEAEWEYACRAGSAGPFSSGPVLDAGAACFAAARTVPVGSFPANGMGLFDMHGNVWEWCWDLYGPYESGATKDPRGIAAGSRRSLRGGAWNAAAFALRSAYRAGTDPSVTAYNIGFRVARASIK